MSDQPLTRQELYDRIREIGKEEFVLEEMIRYGFWPAEGEMPEDPADEIRRRGELQRELAQLRQESQKLQNEQAVRKRLLKERLAQSRLKRQETKKRREQQRLERAQVWAIRQQKEILYLGEEVSPGLNHTESDRIRLETYKLPLLSTCLLYTSPSPRDS